MRRWSKDIASHGFGDDEIDATVKELNKAVEVAAEVKRQALGTGNAVTGEKNDKFVAIKSAKKTKKKPQA